jgi:hypothetical protein
MASYNNYLSVYMVASALSCVNYAALSCVNYALLVTCKCPATYVLGLRHKGSALLRSC